MQQRTILVLGVTGLMGRRIAERLATRLPEAEVIGATRHATARASEFPAGFRFVDVDLESPETFGAAFDGLTDLVVAVAGRPGLFDAIEHTGVVAAARAAVDGGVQRIIHISGTAAPQAPDWNEAGAAKRRAEAALAALPARVVTLRPSWLMESLARFERGGGMALIGAGAFAAHWLAADDLAEVVAEVLAAPGTDPGAYPVLGPEPITLKEAATRYAAARGLAGGIRSMPMPLARLVAVFSSTLRPIVALTRMFERFDEAPLANVRTPFRRPSTTLDQWLR